jgi:GNAT superfamily N-acetyltransferase
MYDTRMIGESPDFDANIAVRVTTAEEIPALEDILRAMGAHKEESYFERCLDGQALGSRTVFVGLWAGRVAGFGMLNWRPRYAPFRRLDIPEIQDLNTHPAFRRRGVATAIVAHCEAQARARGAERMGIGVGLYARYGAAQRLYVRLGYVPDGAGIVYDREPVRPGEIRPVDDDLNLMMVKDLSDGP